MRRLELAILAQRADYHHANLLTPSLFHLNSNLRFCFLGFRSLSFRSSIFAYYLLAAFDFGNESFAGLEARDVVLVDDERRVFRDVASYFAGALLVYERAEATHVNVVALSHRVLHYFEEGFYGRQHIGFFDAGFLRNFGNYLSFGHVGKGYWK